MRLNKQITSILSDVDCNREKILFDDYRSATDRDAYVITLIGKLMFEHDRRLMRRLSGL